MSAASTAAEPRVPERSEQPEAPKEEPQLDTEVPPAAESSPPEQPAPSEGPELPQPAPTDPAPPEPVADALETPAPAEPAPAEPAPAEPAPAEPASAEPAEPASAEPAEPIAGKAEEHHEAGNDGRGYGPLMVGTLFLWVWCPFPGRFEANEKEDRHFGEVSLCGHMPKWLPDMNALVDECNLIFL